MARLDTTCPECGAPHARKLSLIHAEGISAVQTNVDTVGKLNTIGRHKIETKGTVSGTQQTDASKSAAPPTPKQESSIGHSIKNVLFLTGAAVAVMFLVVGLPIGVVLGLVLVVVAVFMPTEITNEDFVAKAEREAAHKRAMATWESTFKCGACGHEFIPVEAVEA